MNQVLNRAELFHGLSDDDARRLAALATSRTLRQGEYLFLLGDAADRLYTVVKGRIELCFPVSLHGVTKDICVESAVIGETVGWSALVRPHRLTLSARAAEPSELAALTRRDLLDFFDAEPRIGYTILTRISEIVGTRLLNVQALWARELQRTIESEVARRAD